MYRKKKQLILTIDDEKVIRESFRSFLEDYEYSVIEAENGRVGLDLFEAEKPDLVLVDLRMPEVDGLEVLSGITEKSPETPVIIVSGTGIIGDAVEALRLGAWDYILKPIENISFLLHAVEKCLERARLKKENRKYREFLEFEVEKRTRQLEQANEELEKRVYDRTAELENTNEELKKAKDAADSAARAKSEFLANMSHEIRTPMNGIIAAADLAMDEKMSPKVGHYLNIIHSSGYSLLGIINDILDFSKIEAGKLDLEMHPFRLNKAIDNAVNPFIEKMLEKNIELIVDVDMEAPVDVEGDPMRIQQIMINLISNAFKFTKEGGVIIVGVSLVSLGNHGVELDFFVKDTGVGIDEKLQKMLFTPFTQADTSTTRKYGGTGLGLSICKQLVDLMGGTITVASEAGQGACFRFTLCLKSRSVSKKEPLTISPVIKNRTILVADDNATSLKLIQKIISSFGCKVEAFSSGEEALVFLAHAKRQDKIPDLAIIDWKMAGLDGVETVRAVRGELALDIPVILMSAFGKKDDIELSDKLLVDGFLRKPFHISSVFDSIMDLFGKGERSLQKPDKDIVTDLSIFKNRVRGMHVLLAEDNPTNQEIAIAIFDTADVLVTLANNGREAVELVMQKDFDAVFMDIQMPEMDGYEATRVIRSDSRYSDLPIIAMTAHAMKGDEQKCLNAGMNGYLPKPVNQEKLFQALSKKGRKKNEDRSAWAGKVVPGLPLERSIVLPGIDVEGALNALNLDLSSYISILKKFRELNMDYISRVWAAFNGSDWEILKNLTHKIKGSSGSIGAKKLYESATILDQASRDVFLGEKKPEQKMVISFEREMDQVLKSIKTLEGERASVQLEKYDDFNALSSSLYGLKSAILLAQPVQIQTALDRFAKYAEAHEVATIRENIDRYDFDEALDILGEIIDKHEADTPLQGKRK